MLECTKEKSSCDSEDEEEKEQNVRHKSLGSPSVSGSGQVDEDECSRIKFEGEEKKPSVRDNGANTVKSGMLSGSTKDSSDNIYEISMLILSMSRKPFLSVLMFKIFYEIS